MSIVHKQYLQEHYVGYADIVVETILENTLEVSMEGFYCEYTTPPFCMVESLGTEVFRKLRHRFEEEIIVRMNVNSVEQNSPFKEYTFTINWN